MNYFNPSFLYPFYFFQRIYRFYFTEKLILLVNNYNMEKNSFEVCFENASASPTLEIFINSIRCKYHYLRIMRILEEKEREMKMEGFYAIKYCCNFRFEMLDIFPESDSEYADVLEFIVFVAQNTIKKRIVCHAYQDEPPCKELRSVLEYLNKNKIAKVVFKYIN